MKHLITLFFIAMPFLLACSCNGKKAELRDAVTLLVGNEIAIPENLSFQILNDTIDFNLDDAEYMIVAYIDSAGCTPCKMRLREWDNLINQLKAVTEADVDFVMIINSTKSNELDYILESENFLHPICFDAAGIFANINKLPKKDTFHTLLLNANHEAMLIGNPLTNPKIRELYKNTIIADAIEEVQSTSLPFGTIIGGDSTVIQFEIKSTYSEPLTIQELVPSCHCISATTDFNKIRPGQSGLLTVTYVADTIRGPISRYIDVYYNEKEQPERYIVYGYVITTN